MHRLLVHSEALKLDSPQLPKEAANHLKVLRPKDGEEIELFDGKGAWRVYRVVVVERISDSFHQNFSTLQLLNFPTAFSGRSR